MSQLVTLVRHAKSSLKGQGQSDFDRPLNSRGRRDCLTMADRLSSRHCIPDLILASSARRTQETADYLFNAFNMMPTQRQKIDDLYLAEPQTLLAVIANVPETVRHLMLIAHNPGLEALSELFAGRLLPPLPTLGIRHFACPPLNTFALKNRLDTHKTFNNKGISLLFDEYPKNDGD